MAGRPWSHALMVVLAVGLFAFGRGEAIGGQSTATRVHHSAAGISIVPPAGWHQLSPRPGDTAAESPPRSAAERQAFLEQVADAPQGMLFAFAKDLQIQDTVQTPSILIRVARMGSPGARSLADLIAAMEAQRDPRLVGPIRRAQVSGLPAIQATLRDTVRVGGTTFPVLAHGHFVPLGTVMLVIDMKAPASSPEATNQVFADALASIRI